VREETRILEYIKKRARVPAFVDDFFVFEQAEEINLSTHKQNDIFGLLKKCVSGNQSQLRKGFDRFIDAIIDDIDYGVLETVSVCGNEFAFLDDKKSSSVDRTDISKIKPFKERMLDELEVRMRPLTNEIQRLQFEETPGEAAQLALSDVLVSPGWDPRQTNHHLGEYFEVAPRTPIASFVETHVKNIKNQLLAGVGVQIQHYVCGSAYLLTKEGGKVLYNTAVLDELY
jgi:hypothetical protein